MQEIIEKINEAERRAEQIKADALEKASEIISDAENRASDIEKLAQVECKQMREQRLKDAAAEAQRRYDDEITVNGAKASKYCADRLKDTDKVVNDVVRRIMRGSR